MSEPTWLPLEVAMAVHEQLLARYGGSRGLRDQNLLESALARPAQVFHYEHAPSLFRLAAAYTHGIVKNHPFIDGNKRIAFMSAYIFSGSNGRLLTASEQEAVVFTLALADSNITESDYADWLGKNTQTL